jgi:tetratricopeptide (TPR) repeat protein
MTALLILALTQTAGLRERAAKLGEIPDRAERRAAAMKLAEEVRPIAQRGEEEACELLTELYQFAARAWIGENPDEADRALRAAAEAQRMLLEAARKRPSSEESIVFAWNGLHRALAYRIDALRGESKLLQGMVDDLEREVKEFMWEGYEFHYQGFEAAIFMGRALAIARRWEDSFMWFARTHPLKQNLKGSEWRLLYLRSTREEMAARIEFGLELRRSGRRFVPEWKTAVALGEAAPGERGAVQLELCRAHLLLGARDRAAKIARDLMERGDPAIRSRAVERLWEEPGILTAADLFADAEAAWAARSSTAPERYRRVLARGDAKLAPVCWLRIGQAYMAYGRPVEAAHALEEAVKFEFGERRAAASLLSRACRLMMASAEETVWRERHARVQEMLKREGWLTEEDLREHALALQAEGRFEEAIDCWNRILQAAKEDRRKIEALACRAYGAWKIAERAHQQQGKDWKRAEPQLQAAMAAWVAYAEFIRAAPEARRSTKRQVESSLDLATHVGSLLGDWPGTLGFAELAEGQPQLPDRWMRIMARRVRALCALGRPLEAEGIYMRMSPIHDRARETIGSVRDALESLSDGFSRAAMMDKYLKYTELLRNYGGQEKPRELMATAGALFEAGVAQGDRVRLRKAREVYERLIGSGYKDESDPDLAFKLKFRVARCLYGEGELARAAGYVDALLRQESDVDLVELRGDIEAGLKRHREAADYYGSIVRRFKMGSPDPRYWRTLYKRCSALFEFGEGQQALFDFFRRASGSGLSPTWDEGEYRPRFLELEELIRRKIPK